MFKVDCSELTTVTCFYNLEVNPMESSLSEDTVNKIMRTTLTKCIRDRNIKEITENLNTIEADSRSKILLDTGTSGITQLSYAIRHNIPKNIIENILNIAEKGGVLKQLLEIKNHHGNTALDFAKKYNNKEIIKLLLKKSKELGIVNNLNKEIIKLLLNKSQESGVVSNLEGGGENITITNCAGITVGDQVKVISEKTDHNQVSNDKKLTQFCSASTPSLSITVDGPTVTISHGSDIHINDKGITVSGKQIL